MTFQARASYATPVPRLPEGVSAVIKIVEKKNHLAVHGLFDSMERAERHLSEVIPVYVAKGYFMDKILRADDFEILVEKE